LTKNEEILRETDDLQNVVKDSKRTCTLKATFEKWLFYVR